jgi:hypothetical protein
MPTTPKAARLTADELAFLHRLLPHFPEYRSESQFLHTATMLGLWVLAVGARRPDLEPFGGYAPDDLAALLGPRILAAIDFLTEQGRLPALVRVTQGPAAGAPPPSGELAYDPDIANDMADLGTEFMDE